MDLFLEGIGERYLMGKANAVPAQLEKLVKKQFKDSTNVEKRAKEASKLPSDEKDEEMAMLRKELAETKLQKGLVMGEAKQLRAGKAVKPADEVDTFDVLERKSTRGGKTAERSEAFGWREALETKSTKSNEREKKAIREVEEVEEAERKSMKGSRSVWEVEGYSKSAIKSQRRSLDHSERSFNPQTAVVRAPRRRSPDLAVGGRSSFDSVVSARETRREVRRESHDLGRDDYFVVEVIEPARIRRKKYRTVEV